MITHSSQKIVIFHEMIYTKNVRLHAAVPKFSRSPLAPPSGVLDGRAPLLCSPSHSPPGRPNRFWSFPAPLLCHQTSQSLIRRFNSPILVWLEILELNKLMPKMTYISITDFRSAWDIPNLTIRVDEQANVKHQDQKEMVSKLRELLSTSKIIPGSGVLSS